MKNLNELYTNEVSLEYLRTLDNSPFTEQQLAGFDDETLAIINKQQAYLKAHPPIAIYRMATEGSQTRNGGVVQKANGAIVITLDNGQHVRVAIKGDFVVYPDGSTAQILTGAGQENDDIALVGSYLSNGDEIINTLQDASLILTRKGITPAKDFLPTFTQ